jgi:2-polyprenyl-6-methoxyphenol hydroxylase-like FAD-dependent oxidoreductase
MLADVALASAPCADDEASINLSRDGVTVIGRLPSGNYRIIATVEPGIEVPEAPDKPYVDQLLGARGIHTRLIGDPAWSSRFRVHHRVADRFRVGGVFLARDAAHVHSPAAGQGMNTGIADAYDLSTRLGAVLTGQADASVLDGYERDRRAAALEVLQFTDRMTRMAMGGLGHHRRHDPGDAVIWHNPLWRRQRIADGNQARAAVASSVALAPLRCD